MGTIRATGQTIGSAANSAPYVGDADRWIAMLVVGYEDNGLCEITSPADAAFAALDLTQDDGWTGTQWIVLDRHSGDVHRFEQEEFAEWRDDRWVQIHNTAKGSHE